MDHESFLQNKMILAYKDYANFRFRNPFSWELQNSSENTIVWNMVILAFREIPLFSLKRIWHKNAWIHHYPKEKRYVNNVWYLTAVKLFLLEYYFYGRDFQSCTIFSEFFCQSVNNLTFEFKSSFSVHSKWKDSI